MNETNERRLRWPNHAGPPLLARLHVVLRFGMRWHLLVPLLNGASSYFFLIEKGWAMKAALESFGHVLHPMGVFGNQFQNRPRQGWRNL